MFFSHTTPTAASSTANSVINGAKWRTRRLSITSNDWANIRRRRPKRQASTRAQVAAAGQGTRAGSPARPCAASLCARETGAKAGEETGWPAVPSHAAMRLALWPAGVCGSARGWELRHGQSNRRDGGRFDPVILSALTIKPRTARSRLEGLVWFVSGL